MIVRNAGLAPAGADSLGVFGEKLRKQREQRGITLESVANTTKISTRMLKALEDEQFDQLPGGVFNKGFVRAYARQVGLNEEEAVTDYLEALGESQAQSQTILPNFRSPATRPAPETGPLEAHASGKRNKNATQDRRIHPERRVEARRSGDRQNEDRKNKYPNEDRKNDAVRKNGGRQEEGSLAEPFHHIQDRGARAAADLESDIKEDSYEDAPTPPPSFLNLSAPSQPGYEEEIPAHESVARDSVSRNSSQPVRWQRLAIPLVLLTLAIALWALHRRGQAARQSPAMASSQTSAPSVTAASSATTPAMPPAATPPGNTGVTGSPTPQPAPVPPVSDVTKIKPSPTAASKPKPLPKFTLIIRAAENSWVAITADGQPVAQENLIAPAATSVRATREIVVKAGNAAGISFLLDGKEFPAQGASGEIRTYTFDANGLRDTSATTTPSQSR